MRYVVLGGGIAGVCCALELARCLQQGHRPQPSPRVFPAAADYADRPVDRLDSAAAADPASVPDQVVLVSSSSVLKGVREVARLSRLVEELEVVETSLEDLAARAGPVLRVVLGTAVGLDLEERVLRLDGGSSVRYDKLCLCTGARPKELQVPGSGSHHPAVLTLRDTDSVQDLSRRLHGCRRLLLVGNGGIALELAGALLQLQGGGPPGQSPHWPAAAPAASEFDRAPPPPPPHTGVGGEVGAAPGALRPPQPELVWVLKQGHVGDAFFDLDAAQFLLQERLQARLGTEGQVGQEEGQQRPSDPQSGSRPDGGGGGGDDGGGAHRLDPAAAVAAAATPGSLIAPGGLQPQQQPQQPQQSPTEPDSRWGTAPLERRGMRVAGHAAGPAWTRELMRGLSLEEQSPGGQDPPAAAPPPAPSHGTGGGAAEGPVRLQQRQGGPGRGVPVAAGSDGGGGGAGGGGGGVGGAAVGTAAGAAGGQRGAFRLVLELSATVSRIDEGGHTAARGTPAAAAEEEEEEEEEEEAEATEAGGATARGSEPWPLYVSLSNGKVYGTDLVVCGIGVVPATEWLPPQLARGADGGVTVGRDMRTSDPWVFAAGDCCTADWPDGSPHWFQMRLWTQARLMGTFAAHCMLGITDELASGFNFELFTHVTRFLGMKVVLLGLYNGQRLGNEPVQDMRLYSRVATSPDGQESTFVRVLMLRGRMQALENVILDGLDLSQYGPHILDEDFELDHVFD